MLAPVGFDACSSLSASGRFDHRSGLTVSIAGKFSIAKPSDALPMAHPSRAVSGKMRTVLSPSASALTDRAKYNNEVGTLPGGQPLLRGGRCRFDIWPLNCLDDGAPQRFDEHLHQERFTTAGASNEDGALTRNGTTRLTRPSIGDACPPTWP